MPDPMPMLPPPGELPETGAVIEHVYERAGSYRARVTVTAGGSDQAYIDRDDGWDVTGTQPLRLGMGS